MTITHKLILAFLALVAAFAFGRYSVQSKTVDKQTNTSTTSDKDIHKHTTTTTTEAPDGSKKTVTIIDENSDTKKDIQQDTTTHIDVASKSTLNVSALAGVDYHDFTKPIYGLSINKNVLGPITVGAYGMTSGLVGLSVGINF